MIAMLPMRAVLAAVVILLQAADPDGGQSNERVLKELPGEVTALVRITFDAQRHSLSTEVLDSLLRSEALQSRLRKSVTEMGYHVDRNLAVGVKQASLAHRHPLGSELLIELTVEGGPEALRALVVRLREALAELAESDTREIEDRLVVSQQRLEDIRAEYEQARARQAQVIAASGGPPHRDEVAARMTGLAHEAERAEQRRAELKAREEYLTRRITEVAAQIERRVDEDALLPELAKLAELRETALQQRRAMADQKLASNEEIAAALEALLQARLQLDARRRQAAGSAVDELDELNRQLSSLALQRTEIEVEATHAAARLEALRKQNLLQLAEDYEFGIRPQLDRLRVHLDNADRELKELQEAKRASRLPQVELMGD